MNIWTSIDWFTIFLYLVLVILGWMNIYASVYNEESTGILDFSQRYVKQLIWIMAALVIAFLVQVVDSRFYSFFAYIIYGFFIAALLIVLIFGREVHGSKSWIELGLFRFQPAEFAKMGTGLALARYLSAPNRKIHSPRTLVTLALIVLIPAFLIMFQPDMGSALVFIAFILVLYREGLSGTILFIGLMSIVLFILALVFDRLFIILGLILLALISLQIIERKRSYTFVALITLGALIAITFGFKALFGWTISHYFLVVISIICFSTSRLEGLGSFFSFFRSVSVILVQRISRPSKVMSKDLRNSSSLAFS